MYKWNRSTRQSNDTVEVTRDPAHNVSTLIQVLCRGRIYGNTASKEVIEAKESQGMRIYS